MTPILATRVGVFFKGQEGDSNRGATIASAYICLKNGPNRASFVYFSFFLLDSYGQCDQMPKMFAQYLAIYNNIN